MVMIRHNSGWGLSALPLPRSWAAAEPSLAPLHDVVPLARNSHGRRLFSSLMLRGAVAQTYGSAYVSYIRDGGRVRLWGSTPSACSLVGRPIRRLAAVDRGRVRNACGAGAQAHGPDDVSADRAFVARGLLVRRVGARSSVGSCQKVYAGRTA